ncbi:MAG: response regulator [Lachnospiraceae bacterium]|nr:response regulator [Lachnospiraceae bacterium]
MYHCHIRFYLAGNSCKAFEVIKEMPPLSYFTHEFLESSCPESALAQEADVILADLDCPDVKENLQILIENRKDGSELIVLAGESVAELLEDKLAEIKDIWTMPMSDKEISFRFLRWQQAFKMSRDFFQTSQYLETTINSVPSLIWYKTKDGIHEKVNDSFCKTVNKTKEQVEGRGHAYIWDVEEDDPACVESEQRVMDKRETCVSDEIIQTGEGLRTLKTYKSPLYDADGSVMGTVGIGIDVTNELAYEQELIKKNRALEKIFASTDCGIICHTVDGSKILSINKTALKILGYQSEEELMASEFDMIATSVMAEDKEKLIANMKKLKNEGDSISVEYRVQHKDGEILHIMGNVKLRKENDELFYQRFLLDCTAQKQEDKKRERRQLELIQALAIDYNLVCFFDLDTGMGYPLRNVGDNGGQFMNELSGELSYQEGMELYIKKYVYEEDRKMLWEAFSPERLKEELGEKRSYYVNCRLIRNGKMEYYQVKAVRAGTWDRYCGIVLGVHSVDEEIRSEIETRNILEDALVQANKANKAKSVFLSNMSHDIRTPMNAIVGFTSLALTHIEHSDQVEEYLKKIMSSGNHLLNLINDVLDMSHIESGKMHLEEKPCSLPEVLHELCNILQADVRKKKLKLQADAIDVLDEVVYCDRLRLNQVLLNLFSNSVKYTNEGGSITIQVREKEGAPAGYANYEFKIRDTGMGMSEEFAAHVFEPFEREKNSTISGIQGTGLGMSITKNIVDAMKGTIGLKSKQGEGTEFTVSFTFRIQEQTEKKREIPQWQGQKALVISEDSDSARNISCMLEQLGMESGQDKPCGLCIIDWLEPDMDVVGKIREIRKEAGESIPVIVTSAYDWSEIEDEAKKDGVTVFCNKPLFESELRNCLHYITTGEKTGGKNTGRIREKLHTGRILLVEDVELNQEIAVAILEDAGFSTEVADNGQVAVDMIAQSEPGYYQLVLMDIQMPVMNGYEATKAIRSLENEELASIPILAMSANAFEEDRRESLKCGMNGHIAKPIDIDKLIDTLSKELCLN